MQQLLYCEIPYPLAEVRSWFQRLQGPDWPHIALTTDGGQWQFDSSCGVAFVWELQRTTYLKIFRWEGSAHPQEKRWLADLEARIQAQFPPHYPALPVINPDEDIFTALTPHYPLTCKYFQQIPNGAYALKRVYWWEKLWREGVTRPQTPRPVVEQSPQTLEPEYDILYVGAALGIIHAARMAQLGFKVAVIERMPFGGMNREWNISRKELTTLVDLGLLSPEDLESIIIKEYYDGLNKFFDGNAPAQARSAVLHTPTVLNVALDAERLLKLCGAKLRALGGEIFDQIEFKKATVHPNGVHLTAVHLPSGQPRTWRTRMVVDAMGSASPIAQQLNGGRAFDSVCPTVGAVIEGFEPGVWDSNLGDVLYSHGDISRGRQLIWELFPGRGDELTFYLFYYHEIHPENPGSLLDLYEDFFTILPEYKRCDLDKLRFKKATFGYIPAHFSSVQSSRRTSYDRILAIGDAASLQSPLVFTGFGSLVRNLPRLTDLLATALRHDLLTAADLDRIRAHQSNIAVTWLFSKGMMVPTGRTLPPERINSILSTFFGIMSEESPQVIDDFIKDRAGWLPFNRMALRAARKNIQLLGWIWQLTGWSYAVRWLPSYVEFTLHSLVAALLGGWVPRLLRQCQSVIEPAQPRLWHQLLTWSYGLSYGVGQVEASVSSALSLNKEVPTVTQP
ncbi:NAD(P)/FAD-dependent oxidoreductase [Candidatus Cyanaurora vandensis]|uniref:NAD(P)/FAD-dependent oxidoreductase n=1 Tax=Candidatus Cyanaurora vandensis TaxID=2714958 RepID=UPI00257A55CD|nr:flavin-dependent dehydrogenase [Candidatus Cyanaurora vandensis]